jgi:hypothetical protein
MSLPSALLLTRYKTTTSYEHEKKERTYHGPRPLFPAEDQSVAYRMENYLLDRDLSYRIAVLNGWYPTSALDGNPRMVIPCSNSAHIPYWQARILSASPGALKRYVSPAASREDSVAVVWPRGVCDGSAIVEGPCDALAAAGCGYVGVALMGNTPPEEVLDFVAALLECFGPYVAIPDLDHPEMGAIVVTQLARRGLRGITMTLPAKKDLAEMNRTERRKLFLERGN